jgi:hypothetical protein
MVHRVIYLKGKRDEVRTYPEVNRLSQTENSREAPNQVDAERKDREAEKLAG